MPRPQLWAWRGTRAPCHGPGECTRLSRLGPELEVGEKRDVTDQALVTGPTASRWLFAHSRSEFYLSCSLAVVHLYVRFLNSQALPRTLRLGRSGLGKAGRGGDGRMGTRVKPCELESPGNKGAAAPWTPPWRALRVSSVIWSRGGRCLRTLWLKTSIYFSRSRAGGDARFEDPGAPGSCGRCRVWRVSRKDHL